MFRKVKILITITEKVNLKRESRSPAPTEKKNAMTKQKRQKQDTGCHTFYQ